MIELDDLDAVTDAVDHPTDAGRAALPEAVRSAIERAQGWFRAAQEPDGYWWAELESNATMGAEYLLMTHFLGRRDEAIWRGVARDLRGYPVIAPRMATPTHAMPATTSPVINGTTKTQVFHDGRARCP